MTIKFDDVKFIKHIIKHYKCESIIDINEKNINGDIENEKIFNTKKNRKFSNFFYSK